jgi:predicted dienelactone hydrolase
MEALAHAGYIVASLHHDDAMPNQHKQRVDLPNFVDAKRWDETKFFDRKEDMSALLDFLLAADGQPGSLLFERIKRGAVGAAGHSLGGYTALGLAGAWASWKDERVAAALLLSPYIHPFYFHGDLKAVKVPVMFQGGTRDIGITPFLKSIYKRLEVPKYYLVMKKVGHYGWTNFATLGRTTTEVLNEGNTKLMADYSVAFFDQHLGGKDRKADLAKSAETLHRWWAEE